MITKLAEDKYRQNNKSHIIHPFEPIISSSSKVLILGSLPSVKSREEGFYYGNRNNRFWKVISAVCGCKSPDTTEEKKRFLENNGIALYDSIVECDIYGSSDASIENVVPADIKSLIRGTEVGIIYCNGTTSYEIFKKYNSDIDLPVVCLPSSSPANASWKYDALVASWMRVGRYLRRTNRTASYYSLNDFVKDSFGIKLYKTPIDGGFTCPNRDGSKGVGGCIFCDNEGSGHFTGKDKKGKANSVREQIDRGKMLVASKMPKSGKIGYIAYFQAYTSTYAPVDRLRELYEAAIEDPEVRILSIATRPDCLEDDVVQLLGELSKRIQIWVELGLQTSNPNSSVLINRCYDNKVYKNAVIRLHKAGIEHVITHVILGLPHENEADMMATVRYACEMGTDGIKLQLLHVLKGTVLADMYSRGEFETLTMEGYTELVKDALRIIPPDVVVHRITGDGDKNKLLAPMWSANKKQVLNYMNKQLKDK